MAKGSSVIDDALNGVKNIAKRTHKTIGEELLSSNGKINDAYNGLFGMKGVYGDFKNRGNIGEDWFKKSLKNNYTTNGKNLNMTNVLGTAAVGAVAARTISGGGLTKDSNGNTNIVALPFI